MTDEELEELLLDTESDRVERKASISDAGKMRQNICAFANDMPDHQKPGVLFVGVKDDGTCADLAITDELLRTLADMRSDGNILPIPSLTVEKRVVRGCEMAIVVVQPSYAPPVRYNGRTWIRTGPRLATATAEEERRLAEKRRARDLPFDLHPITSASLDDLDTRLFEREYLPSAVAPEILADNTRTLEQQLVSVRFVAAPSPFHPTVVGLLVTGKSPADFLPGAYLQFLRIDGSELTDPISNQLELHGPISEAIHRLDDLLRANIHTSTDIRSATTELRSPDYPIVALQQLTRNALMHRDFQTSHAPVRVTWFVNRIEIQNPGGPFGQVNRNNFGDPGVTDYRNPHLSEALKNLGFVQRFGVGIPLAQKELESNGNPAAQFNAEENHILVIVRPRP